MDMGKCYIDVTQRRAVEGGRLGRPLEAPLSRTVGWVGMVRVRRHTVVDKQSPQINYLGLSGREINVSTRFFQN